MKIFKELGWFFKKEKWSYIAGIFALFVLGFINLIPARITGYFIDLIDHDKLTSQILLILVGALIINALLVYAIRYLWRICIFGAAFRLERQLRLDLFKHFTKMSPTFFQTYRIGDLMAHATNDLKAVQRVAGGGFLQFADSVISGSMILIAMATGVSWKLTLVALIPMPLLIIGAQILGKKIHSAFLDAQEAFSDMNDRTHESVNGMKVTKTFGQEKAEVDRFSKQTMDVYLKNMKVTKYDALFDPLISIIIALGFVFIFYVGALLLESGEITVGNLSTFIEYMYQLVWPMMAFGFLYNNLERGSASYERIQKILYIKEDIINDEYAIKEVPNGDIVADIKSFTYPNTDTVVLENIEFTLKQGETLGVVGKTGSGKTTLIKLLLREYDNFDGKISFGDYEIKKYDTHHLHQALSYVPQDQFLFSMSILNNIRFGKMEADLTIVEKVAKMAVVHDDIVGFPEKYETIVGERGVSLSGGQKQRIAIARALLLDAELLILDDSLSAVDAKTEEAILAALKENRQNKTTIIVAHRLSSLKHAHQIIVLDEGKIIERGNHQELIELDGWYAEIFRRQELSKEVE